MPLWTFRRSHCGCRKGGRVFEECTKTSRHIIGTRTLCEKAIPTAKTGYPKLPFGIVGFLIQEMIDCPVICKNQGYKINCTIMLHMPTNRNITPPNRVLNMYKPEGSS